MALSTAREKARNPTPRYASHGAAGARIADGLRDDILVGVYRPGERIRQDELAQRHGASRLPVREALRVLQGEGLVTLVANAGARVSRISLIECQEMYRMRERLEPLLLGMNVPMFTTEDVGELRRLASSMEETTDVEEFLRLDRQFHLLGVSAAPTSVLTQTVLNLWNRTQHYRRAATRLFYLEHDHSVHHDHHLLVGAIRQGDTDEAEHVLERHIRRSRLELARHPEVFEDAASR